jgi:hypothetical protein
MTTENEPWRELPATVAAVIEPELDLIAADVLSAIAAEVPEYARPLEGSFGRGIRTGVGEALSRFVALIRDPDAGGAGSDVYTALGRGEFRQGRTLDSLQAAYRVGARVSWRRISVAAQEAGLDGRTLSLLAESIFAYIDQLAGHSVEGFAQALREQEDDRQRRRQQLALALISEPAPGVEAAKAAAKEADWPWPKTAAVVLLRRPDLARVRSRLPLDALAGVSDEIACLVVPDPDGTGGRAELRRIGERVRAIVGPTVPPLELSRSRRLAMDALKAVGAHPGPGLIRADEQLGAILVLNGATTVEAIRDKRLAPLTDLTPSARARMEATALAYVQHGGNAAAIGRALHLHPQTVRHRIRRLRELLGDQLDRPDARFELEAALRASAGDDPAPGT